MAYSTFSSSMGEEARASKSSDTIRFIPGDIIWGRYHPAFSRKSENPWYLAKVQSVNGDGTCDVVWLEYPILESLFPLGPDEMKPIVGRKRLPDMERGSQFYPGDVVQAEWEGGWYYASVESTNSNNTFKLQWCDHYDDGSTTTPECLRTVPCHSTRNGVRFYVVNKISDALVDPGELLCADSSSFEGDMQSDDTGGNDMFSRDASEESIWFEESEEEPIFVQKSKLDVESDCVPNLRADAEAHVTPSESLRATSSAELLEVPRVSSLAESWLLWSADAAESTAPAEPAAATTEKAEQPPAPTKASAQEPAIPAVEKVQDPINPGLPLLAMANAEAMAKAEEPPSAPLSPPEVKQPLQWNLAEPEPELETMGPEAARGVAPAPRAQQSQAVPPGAVPLQALPTEARPQRPEREARPVRSAGVPPQAQKEERSGVQNFLFSEDDADTEEEPMDMHLLSVHVEQEDDAELLGMAGAQHELETMYDIPAGAALIPNVWGNYGTDRAC